MRLLKLCSHPHCKEPDVINGRCELHQRNLKPNTTNRSSTTTNNAIYNSTKWRKLRKRKFTEEPLCEHCFKLNIITPTDVIDHIKPVLDYPELSYTYSNLQSLCHGCHNNKTAQETKARIKPKDISVHELFEQIKRNTKC